MNNRRTFLTSLVVAAPALFLPKIIKPTWTDTVRYGQPERWVYRIIDGLPRLARLDGLGGDYYRAKIARRYGGGNFGPTSLSFGEDSQGEFLVAESFL